MNPLLESFDESSGVHRDEPVTDWVLRVDGLAFSYPQSCRLFDGLSASLPPGVSMIKGGDGRGKTTLLRLLAGDLTPDAGSLYIYDYSLAEQPAAYRQQVFRCDTQSSAFDHATVAAYFENQKSRWPGFNPVQLAQAVEGLALTDHLYKNIYMLSTGSKRKVWLAAAFAAGASVTLLDEPFSALDTPSIRFVMTRLQQECTAARQSGGKPTAGAWIVADYAAPEGIALASLIDLGD